MLLLFDAILAFAQLAIIGYAVIALDIAAST
jgi:hypothetical protein